MGMEEPLGVMGTCERSRRGWGEPSRYEEGLRRSPGLWEEGHGVRIEGSWKLRILGWDTWG